MEVWPRFGGTMNGSNVKDSDRRLEAPPVYLRRCIHTMGSVPSLVNTDRPAIFISVKLGIARIAFLTPLFVLAVCAVRWTTKPFLLYSINRFRRCDRNS